MNNSDFVVEVVEIADVLPHENADRLEIAKIKEWYCVVGKGQFQKGDRAVYFPIDSVLPPELEATLFPEGSKITLSKHRIRTTNIRGVISQGLLVTPGQVGMEHAPVGTDGTTALGVKKYEPEEESIPSRMKGQQVSKRHVNPYFKGYSHLPNAKNGWRFQEGEPVIVTEKIHGTNFRAGWVPYVPYGFWETLKYRFWNWIAPSRVPQWEFVYGSRKVQLQRKKSYDGFCAENVYDKMVKKYDLENTIPQGQIIFVEIYGHGIQKGYTYGKEENEHDMVVFEVMDSRTGEYQDPGYVVGFCVLTKLPHVPVVYNGPFEKETIWNLTKGASVLSPTQKVREGVVVRSVKEESGPYGRKIFKFISDEYLLKDQSDFH